MEASWYSIGIAILLVSFYALNLIGIENFLDKLGCHVPLWMKLWELDSPTHIATPDNELPPKYPSQWWIGDEQFQLERRAFFSKTWLYATHPSRFQKPGDYRTFEIAGFSFIVILGKDKQLRAFHNVCRHRAYAVTKKESGSTTVLGCRYHGWSYDTRGRLVKAPEFEDVLGFDKSLNGLWELKTKLQDGMVFVNFELGDSTPEPQLKEDMMRSWKIDDMKWVHEWKIEGDFNWKLAENLLADVHKKGSSWMWALPDIFRAKNQRTVMAHTTVVQRLPSGRLLFLRILPLSSSRTIIECSVYARFPRHTKAAQLELETAKRHVELEVKRLNVEQRMLVDGKGSLHAVDGVDLSSSFRRHRIAENEAGRQIHPAARKQSFTVEGMEDDDLCTELESKGRKDACGANSKGLLDW